MCSCPHPVDSLSWASVVSVKLSSTFLSALVFLNAIVMRPWRVFEKTINSSQWPRLLCLYEISWTVGLGVEVSLWFSCLTFIQAYYTSRYDGLQQWVVIHGVTIVTLITHAGPLQFWMWSTVENISSLLLAIKGWINEQNESKLRCCCFVACAFSSSAFFFIWPMSCGNTSSTAQKPLPKFGRQKSWGWYPSLTHTNQECNRYQNEINSEKHHLHHLQSINPHNDSLASGHHKTSGKWPS